MAEKIRITNIAKEVGQTPERLTEFLIKEGAVDKETSSSAKVEINQDILNKISKEFKKEVKMETFFAGRRTPKNEVKTENVEVKGEVKAEEKKEVKEDVKAEKVEAKAEVVSGVEEKKAEVEKVVTGEREVGAKLNIKGKIELPTEKKVEKHGEKKREEKTHKSRIGSGDFKKKEFKKEPEHKKEESKVEAKGEVKKAEVRKEVSGEKKEFVEKRQDEVKKNIPVNKSIDTERVQKEEVTKKEIEKKEVAPEPEIQKIETEYTTLKGLTVKKMVDLSSFDSNKDRKKEREQERGNKNKKKRLGEGKGVQVGGGENKDKKVSGNRENGPRREGAGNKENRNQQGGNHSQGGGFGRDSKKLSGANAGKKNNNKGKSAPVVKSEPTDEEIKKQVRETYEKLQGKNAKAKTAKYKREKKDIRRQRDEQERALEEQESKILKITEFVTVSDLSVMIDVPVNKIIGACMSLGMMVTMNQRLDADALKIVAEEFGYEIEFSTPDVEEYIHIEEDAEEDLEPRCPVVTIMGHVDHGKTSLLDYIRNTNVVAGESGGITQHIGAYSVTLKSGKKITFIDTPGHEAFTAMRARGANITDIVIIVVAADSEVMPQTKEAISHAQAAGVPIIFAINKVDKPDANPDRIKEQLSQMNLLVEEWGGKYQSQDISAKKGMGVTELIDKVLLEAEMLDLKANPNKKALGTVIETFLDKGKGYLSTVLVQAGTLKIGDYVLAGTQSGKVKAMFDERSKGVRKVGPGAPVSVLGLDGAAQAGDKFYVFDDEREAKQIAQQRAQLLREQSVRTQKHITLDEIGRRIALGDFKELNIVLKGDVDGSVEALSNSFEGLSTPEINVTIIHKGVGAITESDVLLATSSEAVIVGFNVRPITSAKALAEKEGIDIRTYSIIYDAIEDLKDAMEGMLSPEMREEVIGNVEIREIFKISKVGTIAGCMVVSGKITRNSKVRVIRDGVVVYTGELASLKRFKDDVKEVTKGFDCGLQVRNFNDIQEGDVIEAFQEVAVKKKL